MRRRIFVRDTGEAMPKILFEQPCCRRFQTEEEREKHRQLIRAAEERRRAIMLAEMDLSPKDRKGLNIVPGVKVILAQIRGK